MVLYVCEGGVKTDRKMRVKIFYESQEIEEKNISFVVIFARYDGKWVFCQAKGRDTWECAGGHVEKDEDCQKAARRELYEETGALRFRLSHVCDYSVQGYDGVVSHKERSWGRLYYAEIDELGKLPEYEMEKVILTEKCDLPWTYPEIQKWLIGKINLFFDHQMKKTEVT